MNAEILQRKWFPVAGTSEIPPKEGRRVSWKGLEVALFNTGEEFYALDGHCPHKSGPLADGIISGKAVFCPLHNWKISLENGCALSGGEGKVKTYPVKVINGKICIAFEEGSLHPCEKDGSLPEAVNDHLRDGND